MTGTITILASGLRGMAALLLLCATSPALAAASTAIPDPTDLTLFALGVSGLIIGRYGSRRRKDD